MRIACLLFHFATCLDCSFPRVFSMVISRSVSARPIRELLALFPRPASLKRRLAVIEARLWRLNTRIESPAQLWFDHYQVVHAFFSHSQIENPMNEFRFVFFATCITAIFSKLVRETPTCSRFSSQIQPPPFVWLRIKFPQLFATPRCDVDIW
jgi:hypothetical protein